MEKVKGICSYAGHSGVAVDPYGVYLVRLQDTELGRQCTVVSNATDLGDTKVQPQTCRIESSLLFPAVRGKDIGPWHSKVSLWVLVTNRSPRKEDQIPETTMRRKLPRAFSYLNVYKSHLLNRGKLWAFYGHDTELRKAPRDCDSLYYRRKRTSSERRDGATIQVIEVPFYAMRDIGSYSFSDHKVVWQMGSNRIKAAVLGFRNTEAGKKPILPCTGTVTYIGCESSEEAHYICACLNSSIANAFFQSFSSAGRGMGAPSILNRIQLSRFDSGDSLHISLSDLSSRCHAAASKDDLKLVASLEAEIDKAAATLWGITDNELKAVQEALAETDKSKRAGKEEDEND
jgi:hypothetical protein